MRGKDNYERGNFEQFYWYEYISDNRMVFYVQLFRLVHGVRSDPRAARLLGEQGLFKASVLHYLRLRLCRRVHALWYIVAMVMIRLFGELWWNYDHKRFNYKGILCLQSSIAWGVICVLLFTVINVRIKEVVHAINPMVVKPLAVLLFVSYSIDFARQFYHSIKDKNSEKNSERMA